MTITQERLKEILDYDPETGWLVWKVRRYRALIGKRAGSVDIDRNGYSCRRIKIEGKKYREHRIIWLWMTGDFPPDEIDHKNLDATDNRWENLRLATCSQNAANQKKTIRNTSGYKGVAWHKRDKKWTAQIAINGKQKALGYFTDPESAHAAYCAAAEAHFGEFARAE